MILAETVYVFRLQLVVLSHDSVRALLCVVWLLCCSLDSPKNE